MCIPTGQSARRRRLSRSAGLKATSSGLPWRTARIGLSLISRAVEEISKLGIPLVEIGTGGDAGHAAARRLYEKAGFTALPLVRYYKALPGPAA